MKYIETDKPATLAGRKLERHDRFNFRCHPGISCFNQCCRNLNLFLYPYDIVRLKQRLKISSDQFLDRYVDIILRKTNFLPEVLLSMAENTQKTCPFLSSDGCSVYSDRPDACRTFPLEQGLYYDASISETTPVYFFKPPDFCMGPYEKQQWTIETWSENQNAVIYNQMTALWSEVKRLFQNNPWGEAGPNGSLGKMAFMATYNIDRFRDFVFKSSMLKRYKIRKTTLKKIKKDDTALMKFGFEWVKLVVWGIDNTLIRSA
ncbi:YkgJ family cysteine cluster protein [Desulfococcaceae bacterium HSG9]|nr:YkgJ family cysteine cluster protein [Desulfococcaceae bacterium HSG9]